MPVDLGTYTPDFGLTPGTTKSDIMVFLYSNPELGYKPAEISDALEIPRGTATTTLVRLHNAGFVGKTPDSYYHALDNHEQIQRYLSSLEQVNRMFGHHRDGDDG